MKVLRILLMLLGLAAIGSAQSSILTGSVYDASGAVVVGARITASNSSGEKLESNTNNDGVYVLNLPFNPYDTTKSVKGFQIAKYEIIVEGVNFRKLILKEFRFALSFTGKMNLDFALDVAENDNCGAGGCIPNLRPVDSPDIKLSGKIVPMPLEKIPKAQKPKQ